MALRNLRGRNLVFLLLSPGWLANTGELVGLKHGQDAA